MNDSINFHKRREMNRVRCSQDFLPRVIRSFSHQQWLIVYSAAALSSDISGDPDEESGQESHSVSSF